MITVDDFAIDAVTKFTPSYKAKATAHPIERGSITTDHVIDEPDTFVMECIVSDAPSGSMVAIRAREDGVPSANAFRKFENLKNTKKLVTVVTPVRVYGNCVLLEFTPTFDAATGAALKFSLSFQVLNVVDNERAFVQVAAPSGAGQDNRGNKRGKKPPDVPADSKADQNSSLLWKLTH